jgi:capsid protein
LLVVALLETLRKVTSFSQPSAYDAAEDRGRRRQISTRLLGEDDHARERVRRILSANTRDLARNFEIAAWAIRKHLDYVTAFSFQAKTADPGYNAELEAFVASAMRRERFDAARRHPFKRALRITEACAVKDGDVLWLKLIGPATRGQIQAIESDRVGMPNGGLPIGLNADEWVNGVRVGQNGASLAYLICDRGRNGQIVANRIVSAKNILHHGFYERFDQVRGISPVAAALNRFRDVYEGFEYALAKAKVSQLFGLKFTREGEDTPFGPGQAPNTEDADGDGTNDSAPEVDLKKGVFSLDLDVGEDAEILESKTPATETVNFLKLMIHVSLKSLDIPYSFFDESFTNFYGSRGGLIQYLKSCETKIEALQEFQDDWATWRLGMAVADGELPLPSGKGFDFLNWEFVPAGQPWWDAITEVRGQMMGIAAGLTSPQRACREIGTDFETNIKEIADAMKIAEKSGVQIVFGDPIFSRAEDENNQREAADAKRSAPGGKPNAAA